MEDTSTKVKEISGKGAFAKYRDVMYGDVSLGKVILAELLITLFGWIPGILGLGLRKIFYPVMFTNIGKKVIFGRNVTIRHPHKITLGDQVIVDDNAVIDAKGNNNQGLVIGNNVYIGRNTIVYCKNGNITLEDRVNLSSNCQVFSSNDLTIGEGTVVGAYSYFLSGGEYDYQDPTSFAKQSGMCTKGPTRVGKDCWLGARVTVLDGVSVGDGSVLAASALINKDIPANSLVAGIPAKVLKENIRLRKADANNHDSAVKNEQDAKEVT